MISGRLVSSDPPGPQLNRADDRQIDVEEKGSLDKAAVIAALGQSGDADYDSVSHSSLCSPLSSRKGRSR
jgi:hypothetical protein